MKNSHHQAPIRFYFCADPILAGQAVRFMVAEGSEGDHAEIGSITFTTAQWSAFAPIMYRAQQAAGLMRIGIQFRDRSHTQIKKRTNH